MSVLTGKTLPTCSLRTHCLCLSWQPSSAVRLATAATPCPVSGKRAPAVLAVSAAAAAAPTAEGVAAMPAQPITISDTALAHLRKLKADGADDKLLLRIGVKSGGCSGMSYAMDFESEANVQQADSVMEYADGFRLVCDQKSLLYLFGMQLDYSNALIGGGFQFHNPNAANSCGCGKSFGV